MLRRRRLPPGLASAGRDFGRVAREAARIFLASQPDGPLPDFAQVTADALDYALAAHGLGGSPVRERLLSLYASLSPYPDAATCLQAVKAAGADRHPSNGSPSMLTAAVASAQLGGLLDYILSVDTVRIYKPSPEVYKLAPNALWPGPAQIAFVSANGWDCVGAAALASASSM